VKLVAMVTKDLVAKVSAGKRSVVAAQLGGARAAGRRNAGRRQGCSRSAAGAGVRPQIGQNHA
jgi:hypothetical protein